MISRFRIFSGPNGSGKSTFFEKLKIEKIIHTEIYVSADRIEKSIKEDGKFVFNAYHISSSEREFFKHITEHGLWARILSNHKPNQIFSLKGGILEIHKNIQNSYSAALIADYLIKKIFISGQSFCYETVMSHKSKLELFSFAKKLNYKTYLYFIYTENPTINTERIEYRAKFGGHEVPEEKIRNRLPLSIKNSMKAFGLADTAYIINNTLNDFKLVASKLEQQIKWRDDNAKKILQTYVG